MTNPYPTVSSKIRAIEECILQWIHDLKGLRFPHTILREFNPDYEAIAKEREAMYQEELKKHLESFCREVANIIGAPLLKEALRKHSKDALQILGLASNPVGFAPTRNSSPVSDSLQVLSLQGRAASINSCNDLPVSEGTALPETCVLEVSPQRNTQLASDTSVQPELSSAALPDFESVESHLTFTNSDKRKAANPPALQPQPKRPRTAATHPSKERLDKPHREPADSQENSSVAAMRKSDTPDLRETAMKALGYTKESTQAETTFLAPSSVQPTLTPHKLNAIRQTLQPLVVPDTRADEHQRNTARYRNMTSSTNYLGESPRTITPCSSLFNIHSQNRAEHVVEARRDRLNSASGLPPLQDAIRHDHGVRAWPTTHNLLPPNAIPPGAGLLRSAPDSPHAGASSLGTAKSHRRGIALYPDPTAQVLGPVEAINRPVRAMVYQATAGRTIPMLGTVPSMQSAPRSVLLAPRPSASHPYGVANSTILQEGTSRLRTAPAPRKPADQHGNAHLNSDVPKDQKRGPYPCPYPGCKKQFGRLFIMDEHIEKKHADKELPLQPVEP